MVQLSAANKREEVALAKPSKKLLERFPTFTLKSSRKLFRAHRKSNCPWWFSSNGAGRFDLTGSQGTCYLADSAMAAFREVMGATLVKAAVVDISEHEDRVISTLRVENPLSLADTTSAEAANHGITKDISTIGYLIPQAWAKAWAGAGMDGVRYAGRFSTAHQDRCYAIFGPAGASSASADPAPQTAVKVAEQAGIRIVPRPASVTIIHPPS